ncbi:MAG: DUF364 domain-containing protein [Gracilibacteraceae bacterium]|jgi:uncharacterized protein (DUF4213/DUF364 family)|nr:DUF364 domain-containing protein [Gracilibacteraceae bacterium]
MNAWKLYDDLIGDIPGNINVTGCNTGYNWTTVTTDEDSMGLAMTIPVFSLPHTFQKQIAGTPLRQLAELSKSWNFVEAAIGVAAIGAYYNHPLRAQTCGREHPGVRSNGRDAFSLYQEEVKGRKVAVVGHFPKLEERFGAICDMTILERNPQMGDYPDTACEYILGEQDYVFLTGCTMVNKTMPRLLTLSQNAKIVLVGPSTILTSVLFDYGVYGLSGMVVHDVRRCENVQREGNTMALFDVGEMVDRIIT